MKHISTTIKRKYLNRILSGKKKFELKGATPYWIKRLHKLCDIHDGDLIIVFLCGKTVCRFEVKSVAFYGIERFIDDKIYSGYYEIKLGKYCHKGE